MHSKKPEEVFLPRTSSIEWKLYINRPKYEIEFEKKLSTAGKNLYIFWMSGVWKSFLYKKNLNKKYVVISAWDIRKQSIEALILTGLGKSTSHTTTRNTKKSTSIWLNSPIVAKWDIEVQNTEVIIWDQNLLKEVLKESEKLGIVYWIIDNIEQISKDTSCVSSIIELAKKLSDDSNYETNVKIILVSTTKWKRDFWNTIQELYSDEKPFKSVLWEIEIGRMEIDEATKYVNDGFAECWLSIETEYVNKILIATDRIPYELAQLCLEIGQLTKRKWEIVIDEIWLNEGMTSWIRENFSTDIRKIDSAKNSNNTAIKLRDKVLFTIAQIDEYSFKSAFLVEKIEFYIWIATGTSAVSQALERLVTDWILERNDPSTSEALYRFCEPKQKLVLRYVLKKNDSGDIEFNRLSDSQLGL